MGTLTTAEKRFVPKEERKTIILEARLMVLFYLAIIVSSVVLQTSVAIWYWFLPVVLGEPVMRAIRMTEHVGRPMVYEMKTNTRSNSVSLPWRFLCWNMNYHAEHHYASSVPFHALPKLAQKLDGYVYVEKRGYLGAHADILSQLTGRSARVDVSKD